MVGVKFSGTLRMSTTETYEILLFPTNLKSIWGVGKQRDHSINAQMDYLEEMKARFKLVYP